MENLRRKGLLDSPRITMHVYRKILIEITFGIPTLTSRKTHISNK